MSSGRGRKGLREKPTYGTTLLGMQKDPAASSSGTATEPDFLPESQSQGRSPHTTHQSMPPPPPYVPPPQYPQHPPQPQPPQEDAAPAPAVAPAPGAVPGGIHQDFMPPDAQYARFTVEDLIQMLGRNGLPIIDPYRLPNTYSFCVCNIGPASKELFYWGIFFFRRLFTVTECTLYRYVHFLSCCPWTYCSC